jgi:hypothetical protein
MKVFQNGVIKRMFGYKRDKITGGWKKIPNEKLHNLYLLQIIIIIIIRMIKSRRERWAKHVPGRGKVRNEYNILIENPESEEIARSEIGNRGRKIEKIG